MTQYPTNLTVADVFDLWGSGKTPFPGADHVYYWHDDSEVVELVELPDRTFRVHYADGTYDEGVSRLAFIVVQKVNWEKHTDE